MAITITGRVTQVGKSITLPTPLSLALGDTGIFAGGAVNTIEYITISTLGDATDFGDLAGEIRLAGATSNGLSDRGVIGGGFNPPTTFNIIDYFTITTPTDAESFGDLTFVRYGLGTVSNGTNDRGVFAGGNNTNYLDYITISSLGDAVIFGTLLDTVSGPFGISNATNDRGVFSGGPFGGPERQITYITISSTGNAEYFGNMTIAADRRDVSGASNGTNERGVFAGGGLGGDTWFNVIDYITISTLGNAANFGDISVKRRSMGGVSNGTNERGVFAGGYGNNLKFNIIEYITISSLGNAADFGDLSGNKTHMSGASNA